MMGVPGGTRGGSREKGTKGMYETFNSIGDLAFTDGRTTYIDLDDPRLESILERYFIG